MRRERCQVVLVRPAVAGNIGATARVMANFGLERLVLVAPEARPVDAQARSLATHGEGVLEAARCVDRLEEAIAECGLVIATSAAVGGLFRAQTVTTPRELMPMVVRDLDQTQVALVFGPERTGLRTDEVSRCHHLIHIPAAPEYPVLNLAQAVAICLYELHMADLERQSDGAPAAALPFVPSSQPAAPFALQERVYDRWREALEAIHFLWDEKADAQMHALRHVLGRARPSEMEARVLLGVARQIMWYVEHKGPGGGSLAERG
ncbi:MAG TPA: RNA methyltransferase [Gemmatales bacterium]|nr:RNA methyltransferase [Gemmatales bacterium]HMP59566.1 RNA methyltransferase [Gemmatales bacterium]